MTAQLGETLWYNGEEYRMVSEPFSVFLHESEMNIRLYARSTAVLRGYIGEWKIEDDKLYLTRIEGSGRVENQERFRQGRLELRKKLKAGEITPQENGHLLKSLKKSCYEPIDLSLESLFGTSEKVFADWFTGTLRCTYGDLLNYIHLGFASTFSKELLLDVEAGQITAVRHVENQKVSS